jgi:hypothetical protein
MLGFLRPEIGESVILLDAPTAAAALPDGGTIGPAQNSLHRMPPP